eukprot:Gb_04821 [translate_table: standard]
MLRLPGGLDDALRQRSHRLGGFLAYSTSYSYGCSYRLVIRRAITGGYGYNPMVELNPFYQEGEWMVFSKWRNGIHDAEGLASFPSMGIQGWALADQKRVITDMATMITMAGSATTVPNLVDISTKRLVELLGILGNRPDPPFSKKRISMRQVAKELKLKEGRAYRNGVSVEAITDTTLRWLTKVATHRLFGGREESTKRHAKGKEAKKDASPSGQSRQQQLWQGATMSHVSPVDLEEEHKKKAVKVIFALMVDAIEVSKEERIYKIGLPLELCDPNNISDWSSSFLRKMIMAFPQELQQRAIPRHNPSPAVLDEDNKRLQRQLQEAEGLLQGMKKFINIMVSDEQCSHESKEYQEFYHKFMNVIPAEFRHETLNLGALGAKDGDLN